MDCSRSEGGHRDRTDVTRGCLDSEGEENDSRSTGKTCWAEPKSTAMEISMSETTVSMAGIDLRFSCMKSDFGNSNFITADR